MPNDRKRGYGIRRQRTRTEIVRWDIAYWVCQDLVNTLSNRKGDVTGSEAEDDGMECLPLHHPAGNRFG